jgi:hypothetical protein
VSPLKEYLISQYFWRADVAIESTEHCDIASQSMVAMALLVLSVQKPV